MNSSVQNFERLLYYIKKCSIGNEFNKEIVKKFIKGRLHLITVFKRYQAGAAEGVAGLRD